MLFLDSDYWNLIKELYFSLGLISILSSLYTTVLSLHVCMLVYGATQGAIYHYSGEPSDILSFQIYDRRL